MKKNIDELADSYAKYHAPEGMHSYVRDAYKHGWYECEVALVRVSRNTVVILVVVAAVLATVLAVLF